MRDPCGEYHKRGQHEDERGVVHRGRVLRVRESDKADAELHAGHLEGHSAGVVDRFLHAVAGNAALDELMLAELADLKGEAPLAVDSLNDRLFGEDKRARAGLEEREGDEKIQWRARDACRRCRCRKNSSKSLASSRRTVKRTQECGLLGVRKAKWKNRN